MIKDISGVPLIVLIVATIIDMGLVTIAFKSFIKNGK